MSDELLPDSTDLPVIEAEVVPDDGVRRGKDGRILRPRWSKSLTPIVTPPKPPRIKNPKRKIAAASKKRGKAWWKKKQAARIAVGVQVVQPQLNTTAASVTTVDAVASVETCDTNVPALGLLEAGLPQPSPATDVATLERFDVPNESGRIRGHDSLTIPEITLMFMLKEKGLSQAAIANRLNTSQANISRQLAAWEPTAELAKRRLKSGALQLAERVLDKSNVEESLEVLDRLNILEKKAKDGGGNPVTVNIGIKADTAELWE